MNQRKSTLGVFLKGLLIGGLTASIVSLFTAPQSGIETRRMLRAKGEQMRDGGMHAIENTRGQVNSLISNTRQHADQIVQGIENIGEKVSQQIHHESD